MLAMQRFQNILVATDTRLPKHPIVDEAAEVARRSGASLTIVDVVPALPWIARLTMEDPDHVASLMMHEKAVKLEDLATPIRQRGVPVNTKVLVGKSSLEIIREVIRGNHDLVLGVAKAMSSRRQGFFGATAIELLRKCPCAVWLVCPDASPRIKHVLACVNTNDEGEVTNELAESVFEISRSISHQHGADFSLVQAWSIDAERSLRKRMSDEEFEQLQRTRLAVTRKRLDRFLAAHPGDLLAKQVHLIKGESSQSIQQVAVECRADLVVLGSDACSSTAGWILGNTTEHVLEVLECSILALKPAGFVSPVQAESAAEAMAEYR
jgi:nucleotide-binding universal stress UspA family protein